MEEDTAKLSHDTKKSTLVDFNRAGVPLVEIVSDPDMESAAEAKTYCQELQQIFRYLEVSDADMEKGHMRCEANISIQEEGKFIKEGGTIKPLGGYKLNSKVEVKNINSFRAVEKAVEYEIARQTKLIEKGETWKQQTRGWNDDKGETILQREKETSADYRYFPEPDIPPFHPLKITKNLELPELPQTRRARFRDEYGFSFADAEILAGDKHWARYAEEVMGELVDWIHSLSEKETNTDEVIKNKKASLPGWPAAGLPAN